MFWQPMNVQNNPYLLLVFLVLGSILFLVGNEQLLTYTRYEPASHMTRIQFQTETTESIEARVWWIIQLGGLTFALIALLEIALLGGNIHRVT